MGRVVSLCHAPKAFSVPGPCCIAKTPTRLPDDTRLNHRPCGDQCALADNNGPDIGDRCRLDDRIDGIADENLDAFTFENFSRLLPHPSSHSPPLTIGQAEKFSDALVAVSCKSREMLYRKL